MESALSKHNIITTDMMEEYGITRSQFMYFVKANHYKRITKGTYQYVGDDTFKLYKLNHRSPVGVLSHNTALFYHGLIEKIPDNPSITLGIGYNSKNFNKSGVKVYTVKKEVLYLGLINTEDVFGNPYHVYNLERTIVDLVRSRNYVGIDLVGKMLRKYLEREDKDLEKLYEYAKVFRVEKIIKEYLGILMGNINFRVGFEKRSLNNRVGGINLNSK